MDKQNVKINGVDVETYGVLSEKTPVISLPKDNYQRLVIPNRIIPQYQKTPDKQNGYLTLILNGIFESIEQRVAFETDIIHKISNQALSTVEFESSLGIEYQCLLSSQIEIEELYEDELLVKYTLDFTIELYIKK